MMDLKVILPQERIDRMVSSGRWLNRTAADFMAATVQSAPDRLLVSDFRSETGASHRITYGEMDRHARRVALTLAGLGVQKGDVVSFQMPNWWEFIALHLGCVYAGAISNPLMPIFRERELAFMLGFAETKVYIAPRRFRGHDYRKMMDGLRAELPQLKHCFFIGDEDEAGFAPNFLGQARETEPGADAVFAARRMAPDDVTQILYTSGTTGQPKGVMHTANTLFSAFPPYIQCLSLTPDDIAFMASPMAHQTGFCYGMLLPILLGGSTAILDAWIPKEAARIISECGATHTLSSTPFLADLTDLPELPQFDMSRFASFVSAGAPIPRTQVDRAVARLKCNVLACWGMTENTAVTCCKPSDAPEKIFETDGCALDGMAVKVVDANGKDLPPGEEGILKAKAQTMFVGYLKRPEAFGHDADDWFDTGDYARMDEDGYIRITGRAKDIIIRGGENIPVVEIEELLYRHPAIHECAIVGMPDARLGERACVFAGLKPGHSLTFQEMIDYLLSKRLTRQYLPEKLVIREALPRTPSGKIQKFKLRDEAKEMQPDRP
ncbi:MAG: AMP-binding protein [Alphaproteobacteria bacterium]